MALSKAKIISVTSVKGGVGKTTTALTLAGILSQRKKRTLIIDLDLYSGGIGVSTNVDGEKDIFNLTSDILNNKFDYIENYVAKYNKYIDCIISPRDPRMSNKISSKYIPLVLRRASYKYDYIIIDTNHIQNEITLTGLYLSDYIIYLISNNPIDLKNIKSTIPILNHTESNNYLIVLNESLNNQKRVFSNYEIQKIINKDIDFEIPKSFNIKNINEYLIKAKIPSLDKKLSIKYRKELQVFEKILDHIDKKVENEEE